MGRVFAHDGFVIHKDADGEFIYAVRLATGPKESEQAWAGLPEQAIVKLTLDGQVVRSISAAAIPDRFKNKNPDGRPYLRLTGIAVAPNGDIYVTDGYASDYIHRFDRTGKYLASFGGRGEPYNFRTLHKLAIDTRSSPPRLIACDRANNRVVHLSLHGEMLGIVAS
jgi:outer membrane protein assembly factor BamB